MNLSLTLGALNVLSKFQAFYTLDSLSARGRSSSLIYIHLKVLFSEGDSVRVKLSARQRIERETLNDVRS